MPSWLHQSLMWLHIAAGCLAILSGAAAVAARKGSRLHAAAGSSCVGSMLTLGVTASILEPSRMPEPGSPIVGVFVCYFVLTSWVTAQRHDGTAGKFEAVASLVALGPAAAIGWSGISGGSTTPAGQGPLFFAAGLFLFAGLGDLGAYLRRKLTPAQRVSRHLWRMCFAFFIATGSFFLGQQDVMPQAVRGSPILFVLAFAPFAAMAFWLVRLRLAKRFHGLMPKAAEGPVTVAS